MERQAKKNSSVRAVPEGFHTVTPYLIVNGAAGLIEFMETAFGAVQTHVTKGEDDMIIHATLRIGDSTIMVADTMNNNPPQSAMLHLYVEDADETYRKAVAAQGVSVREPATEFYGDRAGAVKDKWDNLWWIASHVEDVDPEELDRRAKAEMKKREKELETQA